MKKYFAVFVVALLSLVGCDDPLLGGNDGPTGDLEGQWHIVEWNGSEPEFDIYLSFLIYIIIFLAQLTVNYFIYLF